MKNVEVNCSILIHISNEIEEKTYFGFATRSKIFISFSRNSFVHCISEVVHIKFALFSFFSFTRRPNLFKVRYDMISPIGNCNLRLNSNKSFQKIPHPPIHSKIVHSIYGPYLLINVSFVCFKSLKASHSPEIRRLHSMKCSSEMLPNLL